MGHLAEILTLPKPTIDKKKKYIYIYIYTQYIIYKLISVALLLNFTTFIILLFNPRC